MELEGRQAQLRTDGYTVITQQSMGLGPDFSRQVQAAFFSEAALPPVPDTGGPVPTRYRSKAVIHYRRDDRGYLYLREVSDEKYALIGCGAGQRRVPWFEWLSLPGAERFTRRLLSMIPPEQRHPEGAFGLHCFRSFAEVVNGPHADGFEFGGTYVVERTAGGAVSYLNRGGTRVLDHQLQPGEVLLFHEHFPDQPPMFTHGATPLEPGGYRDAIVLQIDAPEDLEAVAMEKADLGNV